MPLLIDLFFLMYFKAMSTEETKDADGCLIRHYTVYKSGMFFGESALINSKLRNITVTPRKDLTVLCLKKEYIFDIFPQTPINEVSFITYCLVSYLVHKLNVWGFFYICLNCRSWCMHACDRGLIFFYFSFATFGKV